MKKSCLFARVKFFIIFLSLLFFSSLVLPVPSASANVAVTAPIYVQGDRLFVQDEPTSLFGYGFYAQITDKDFDYQAFLNILSQYDVNFTRVWGLYHAVNSSDLLLPFTGSYRNWDLMHFNPEFFNRLRGYVAYAQSKGIVVQFTLFDYNLLESSPNRRWPCNPYNPNNNITDPIKTAGEFDNTSGPIWEINKRYIQEVVRAIGGYNNVIYEIFNEPESIGDSNFHRAVENLLRQELAKYSGSKIISVNGDKYAAYGDIIAYHHPSSLESKAQGSGKPVILSNDGSGLHGGSGQIDSKQVQEVLEYKNAVASVPPGKASVEILDNDIWGSSYTSQSCPSPRNANHNLIENSTDPWGINYLALGLLGGEETFPPQQEPEISDKTSEGITEECNLEAHDRDSRPAPCNICHTTDLLTPSCATAFNAYDGVEYKRNEGEGAEHWIERDWGGTVNVDPTRITIPFVGKKGSENEQQTLADYFEGTNEYYYNYGNQNLITNFQGILRKLTPMEYQDQLKKQLVKQASEETIHNYKVEYIGRLCWDVPFWVDAAKYLMEKFVLDLPDATHYCLFEDLKNHPGDWLIIKAYRMTSFISNLIPLPDGKNFQTMTEWISSLPGMLHYSYTKGAESNLSQLANRLPPDPNEENYQEKFLAWKEADGGKWYKLWQATPMLSREDTPGEIHPYLGEENPEDKFEIKNEDATIEKVPHLERLYEASQKANQLLIPAGQEIEMPASPSISESTPPYSCLKEDYILGPEGDSLCCQEISAELTAKEKFKNPKYEECIYGFICPDGRTNLNFPGPCNPSCLKTEEYGVSRGIGVNLFHPYLDQIWAYTANPGGGIFNIFRPYEIPPFEDIDAADTISYKYDHGEASPQEGLFYFNHLGGIQRAKEWVVNKALWPYEKK